MCGIHGGKGGEQPPVALGLKGTHVTNITHTHTHTHTEPSAPLLYNLHDVPSMQQLRSPEYMYV